MKIFISWSGARSRAIAKAFNDWLPFVVHTAEPFFSPEIEKGTKGVDEINQNLADSNFGILCLTPENLSSNWVHYEAGALSKISGLSRVWPFLCELKPTDVVAPLSQFQNTASNRDDVLGLVRSIDKHSENPMRSDVLLKVFEKFWPELESALSNALTVQIEAGHIASSKDGRVRKDEDVLDEILQILRLDQARRIQQQRPTFRESQEFTGAIRPLTNSQVDPIAEAELVFASVTDLSEAVAFLSGLGDPPEIVPFGRKKLILRWSPPIWRMLFDDLLKNLTARGTPIRYSIGPSSTEG